MKTKENSSTAGKGMFFRKSEWSLLPSWTYLTV